MHAVLGAAAEGDEGPFLRNAKDGCPTVAEGAKRPRDSEKGPAAKPPGMWVRRQATEGECGGVHGVVAEVHPREGSIEGRQKKKLGNQRS